MHQLKMNNANWRDRQATGTEEKVQNRSKYVQEFIIKMTEMEMTF